jgi:hypothetical protein
MKGTLHKTQSGWQVWYHAKDDLYHGSIRVRILPLLQDDAAGLFIQDTDSINDGKEVEFEIVEFPVPPTNGPVSNSISKYAKLVHNWLTMKEGDITVNFKLMPEFDEPEYPEVNIICPRCKALMPCECNNNWDVIYQEFIKDTDGISSLELLKYLRENYNPPTKKQNNNGLTRSYSMDRRIYLLNKQGS